jgi:hypothetical protein
LEAGSGGVFDLKIGNAVDDNAVAPEGYEIDPLLPVDCQTILYGGSLAKLGLAFQKFAPELYGYGRSSDSTPTGEMREYVLYFEDPDSPNNVTLIAAVVK